jgi:hypothetical protein
MKLSAVMVAVVVAMALGCVLLLQGNSGGQSSETATNIGIRPVYGPLDVKSLTVNWVDREEPSVFDEGSRLTVYDQWVRFDEPTIRAARKYDTIMVPRSRIRELVIEKK